MSNKLFMEQSKNHISLLKNKLNKDIFNIIFKVGKVAMRWVFLQTIHKSKYQYICSKGELFNIYYKSQNRHTVKSIFTHIRYIKMVIVAQMLGKL